MTFLSRRSAVFGSVTLLVGAVMLSRADRVSAAPPADIEKPVGLVWFIGTVEQVVDGVPLIDLGEVHTLRKGSMVTVIRYRDSHFAPLGVLEIRFSNPGWCQTETPVSFAAEVGDLVMFVEAPGDLGSGDAIRDGFIRHRIVTNANRNRYSSARDSIEADTLLRVIEKQPKWVQGKRRIAGIIRSPSVSKDLHTRLKPFMNQILTFQDYQDQGVDIAEVTSAPWQDLLTELRHGKDLIEASTPGEGLDMAAEPIVTENTVDQSQLVTVRRLVDASMFQRFAEERNTIAAICAALLYTKTSNERQWMSQQLAKSQFPALSNQEQTLIDMEAIMRQLRKAE